MGRLGRVADFGALPCYSMVATTGLLDHFHSSSTSVLPPFQHVRETPTDPLRCAAKDIDMEIPEQHRSTVLTLYRVWMFLIIVLIVNLVSAILLLISGGAFGTARRKVRRTLTARAPLFCSKQWRGGSRRSGHVPPCDWCTFYQPSHTLG